MHRSNHLPWLNRMLVAIALVLSGAAAAAQQGVPVDEVQPGTSLRALVEVPVRDRTPSGGALYVKGQQTGALKPREVIVVAGEQTVSTVLGKQKWIYFSRSGPAPANGWVLVGSTGSTIGSFARP